MTRPDTECSEIFSKIPGIGTVLPLQGRRVLVTAGPTWVRIDAVRHIGNMSSGRTGLLIARAAAHAGAEVRLLMGPGQVPPTVTDYETMTVEPFVTFDDLHLAVRSHVATRRFDAMIHTAAVSDYRPILESRGKLSSNEEELIIRMRRTPKIVDEVKTLDPEIVLVKFKLEVGRDDATLLDIAQASLRRSSADLLVANDLDQKSGEAHAAIMIDEAGLVARTATTEELAERLIGELSQRLKGHAVALP